MAELLLVSVTIFWGGTFPPVKMALEDIPVLGFLWIRFVLAAVLLARIAGCGWRSLDRQGGGGSTASFSVCCSFFPVSFRPWDWSGPVRATPAF